MEDQNLLNIWKSYDQKLDAVLSLNKSIVENMTRDKMNRIIGSVRRPKRNMLMIGVPYTIVLYLITFIAISAGGLFVAIGFAAISLIMTGIILGYFYQLNILNQINRSEQIVDVQERIAKLKISTFNITRLALVQLPFWSICWMSLDGLKSSPLVYGSVNLVVFLGLAYLAFWLYKRLDIQNNDSKVSRFFLSGNEWEPIVRASNILDQLAEYTD